MKAVINKNPPFGDDNIGSISITLSDGQEFVIEEMLSDRIFKKPANTLGITITFHGPFYRWLWPVLRKKRYAANELFIYNKERGKK